jgi:DNA-3-methyladenine glycosylase
VVVGGGDRVGKVAQELIFAPAMARIKRSFYRNNDVVDVARTLLGKVLVSHTGGVRTTGIITETEAYAGVGDRASHAFGGRRTARNEVMYGDGGVAYVYLCYGIHHLFNVVTHTSGTPHAVLVRAIHPLEGIEVMKKRRGARFTTNGPGTLTQALGITTSHNGTDLLNGMIHIEDRKITVPDKLIKTGPRIGVEYAKEDALLPYRFHYDHRLLS